MHRHANGHLATLGSDPNVFWADSVAHVLDGFILFTDSAIPSYIDQLARPPSLKCNNALFEWLNRINRSSGLLFVVHADLIWINNTTDDGVHTELPRWLSLLCSAFQGVNDTFMTHSSPRCGLGIASLLLFFYTFA